MTAISRGVVGPQVAAAQQRLLELNFKMPLTISKGGPDGVCGNEMLTAFSQFMSLYAAESDADRNTIDDTELQLLNDVHAKMLAAPYKVLKAPAINKPYGHRREDQITAICLHHTATILGEREQRWASVVAHYGITRSGARMEIYDPTDKVGHGGCRNPPSNGWNERSVGVEVDGKLFGLYGVQRSVWNDPSIPGIELGDEFLPRQRHALGNLIDELCAKYPSIKFLVSHRQSAQSREADPGQQMWHFALEMMAKHNLTDGSDGKDTGFFIDSGRPNPKEWDPSHIKNGYWDPAPNYKG